MGRQVMSATLTRRRRRPFLGSCRWIWVFPPVALAGGVRLAARVDRQLLQLLVSGPLADRLLPLLDPLQVALALLVPVLPTLAWRAGARHLGGL